MSTVVERGRDYEIEEIAPDQYLWTGQAGLCYPDEHGEWHRSDCSIAEPILPEGSCTGLDTLSEPEEFTLTCDTIEFPVAFSSFASGGQKIRTRDNKCFVVMRAQDVYDVQGTVADNKVLYEGAWDDSDLEFYATPEGLVKNITLHKRPAINTWTFEIEHFGLGMVEGDKEITWNRDGEEIWRTRKPWASDAENNYIEGTLTVRRDGGRIFYDVSIDPDWLDKAIYPVLVDPSTTLTPSTADAEISSANPDSNYGAYSQATIYIDRNRALFRFSELPSGIVNSATFGLNLSKKPPAGNFWAYKVTHQDWVESEVTWKSYKSGYSWTNFGGDYVTSNPGAGTATVISSAVYFDVNEIVADAISNNIDANFIIMSSVHVVVYTRENATASPRPKLTIDYTPIVAPTVTTGSASSISATGATLNGTLSADGGEACTCSFQWGKTTSYGNTTGTSSKTTGQTFALSIPGLSPNTTYHYRAKAVNSAGTSYGSDKTFQTLDFTKGSVDIPGLATLGTTGMRMGVGSSSCIGFTEVFVAGYRQRCNTALLVCIGTVDAASIWMCCVDLSLSGQAQVLADGLVTRKSSVSMPGTSKFSTHAVCLNCGSSSCAGHATTVSCGCRDRYASSLLSCMGITDANADLIASMNASIQGDSQMSLDSLIVRASPIDVFSNGSLTAIGARLPLGAMNIVCSSDAIIEAYTVLLNTASLASSGCIDTVGGVIAAGLIECVSTNALVSDSQALLVGDSLLLLDGCADSACVISAVGNTNMPTVSGISIRAYVSLIGTAKPICCGLTDILGAVEAIGLGRCNSVSDFVSGSKCLLLGNSLPIIPDSALETYCIITTAGELMIVSLASLNATPFGWIDIKEPRPDSWTQRDGSENVWKTVPSTSGGWR